MGYLPEFVLFSGIAQLLQPSIKVSFLEKAKCLIVNDKKF